MIALHPEDRSFIRGTVDQVPATALVNAKDFPQRENGQLEVPFVGETDVHWSGQWTQKEYGERLFMSEDGNYCTESKILLHPDSYAVRAFDSEQGKIIAECTAPSMDGGEVLFADDALDWALEHGDWDLPENKTIEFEVTYEDGNGGTLVYEETR